MNEFEIKTDFNRVLKTINHEEPDRVPLFEVLIEYPIQSQFLGREVTSDDLVSQVEFWTKAGYDAMPITVGIMEPGKVTEDSAISKVIKERVQKNDEDASDKEKWNLEFNSFINDREDFEVFPWDVLEKLDYDKINRVKELLPHGMKAIAITGKIFTLTWMLLGFNNFALSIMSDRELVADVFNKVAEIQYNAFESILDMDHIGAVWAIDDIAFGTGPIIMPEVYREFVFPCYHDMAIMCHKKDRPFIMHSDGDLTSLMPDLIDIGIDVLHPIDPTCMDIYKMKKEYGERICLCGNVSNELLQKGTPLEVENQVKTLLQDIAPGGGYLLAAGNSVPAWAKFENYMALRDTGLKYGAYPINI